MHTVVTGAFLAITVLSGLCSCNEGGRNNGTGRFWTDGSPRSAPHPDGLDPREGFAPVVDKVKFTVVNLYTTQVYRPMPLSTQNPDSTTQNADSLIVDPNLAAPPPPLRRTSLGSGVLIHDSGLILTNNHVVLGATRISALLGDGRSLVARVVGREPRFDLALIQVDSPVPLPRAMLGDSDRVRVGSPVVAIGNPFGLVHSVTAGVVSARARQIGMGPLDEFLQTDVSIHPGNSGGPLFDATGLVIGIATAGRPGAEGIGFAVPSNQAKRFITEVMERGGVVRGWLGIGTQPVTRELAHALGFAAESSGVVVTRIEPGSPAQRAGLRLGDLVRAVDDSAIHNPADLLRAVASHVPGDRLILDLLRGGRPWTVSVLLIERPDTPAPTIQGTGETPLPDPFGLGLIVRPLNAAECERSGLRPEQGVVVAKVFESGPAALAGLLPGDVVLEMNRTVPSSVGMFEELVASVPSGGRILMLLFRGDENFYTVFPKP
jgi:serine protease Do